METIELTETRPALIDQPELSYRSPARNGTTGSVSEDKPASKEISRPLEMTAGDPRQSAMERTQRSSQLLTSLTPALSVALTGVMALLTLLFQVHQDSRTADEKEDTEWRATLQTLSTEDKSLLPGALSLQSFFTSKRYSHQARSLNSLLLPRLADTATFDIILFDMADQTTEADEEDLLSIDRATANELRTLYDRVIKNPPPSGLPDQPTFEDFLANPDAYLRDSEQTQDLKTALADDWKLDSATAVLWKIWTGTDHKKGLPPPIPSELDGVVFIGANLDHDPLSAEQYGAAEFHSCKDGSGQIVPCHPPTK